MFTCYIGLGSNLGDRRRNIRLAIDKIRSMPDTALIKKSRIIETKPVGGPSGQGKFLNSALRIKTCLAPSALLKHLKRIERELGRVKTVRHGPRVIDLDILLYGEKIVNRKDLKIPHPAMFEREFVLRPLSEII